MKLERVGIIRVNCGTQTDTIVDCLTTGLTDYHYTVTMENMNVADNAQMITLFAEIQPVTPSGEENIENEG